METPPPASHRKDADLVWRYGGLAIRYRPELDGGGRELADDVVDFVRDRLPVRGRFRKAFEWCSGPGFLGFALLEQGVCERLCLADVNPVAVECARRTVRDHGLADRVACYLSDGLRGLPAGERFDLVVSNPPNFCCLNPRHPRHAELAGDLRPHDPGWRIHRDFYATIRRHLEPGALLCISEVEPHRAELVAEDLAEWIARIAGAAEGRRRPPVPFEVRPRPPLEDFRRMIRDGGLAYRDCLRYRTVESGLELWMVVSSATSPRAGREAPGRASTR